MSLYPAPWLVIRGYWAAMLGFKRMQKEPSKVETILAAYNTEQPALSGKQPSSIYLMGQSSLQAVVASLSSLGADRGGAQRAAQQCSFVGRCSEPRGLFGGPSSV
ncbi:predicted protein [Aspergillus nidulans FGSC A4]|uniref:Uncharacterized protein n=1 Tax=Emericella nidulans (strain FGSC A4 / ATCC 38163 / CBS 112.46 / NRRL 194 / M139) TaxID=227321 RepID=Q5AWY2_EMENI|nr:hypothetical protein [Aspergillus nidulans FGSC A4]EAA61450.1 predicted protein [Aspergillus nidulans FGSC A4]CBF78882.1 TPA: hypothetical protein ANIA_07198 [Aspergillus nidulans FGSC A4]|eukprot:XP_664802.1 predicted protein [Aspergillus nidulans FGSC A4]